MKRCLIALRCLRIPKQTADLISPFQPALLAGAAALAPRQRASLISDESCRPVLLVTTGISISVALVGSPHAYAEPDWNPNAIAPNLAADRLLPGRMLQTATSPVDPNQLTRGLASLGDVRAGGQPVLAKEVLPSFIALRQAVIDASGHDFLARLSEANRAIGFGSDTSSYASWHKSQ